MNPKNLAEAAEAYYTALVAKNMQSPLASVREGLAVESALDEAHKQLLNVAKMAPSDRTRTADIYDPTSGLFTPTQVPETLRLAPRERIPGDRIVISVAEFDRLQELEVDTEIASLGPPDAAEHDRVAAALAQGGTIAEGARVLGVSKKRIKLLIVQHRVEWPRKPAAQRELEEGIP